MKSGILKGQNHGVFYIFVKIIAFLVAVVSMRTIHDMSVERAIRIIGYIETTRWLLPLLIPKAFQRAFEMIQSVQRIEVRPVRVLH